MFFMYRIIVFKNGLTPSPSPKERGVASLYFNNE